MDLIMYMFIKLLLLCDFINYHIMCTRLWLMSSFHGIYRIFLSQVFAFIGKFKTQFKLYIKLLIKFSCLSILIICVIDETKNTLIIHTFIY